MTNFKELFNEWNDKFFKGKLGHVSLHTYSRRSNTYGFFRRSFMGKSININTFQNGRRPNTESDQHHSLLHEMTHAYLNACNLPCGHTPLFKRMLKDLTYQVFGIRPTSNISHVINLQGATINRPMPVPTITKEVPAGNVITVMNTTIHYKVIGSGEIGTFKKFSEIYGHKMITIVIEGKLFPFTTGIENVVAV